MGKDIKNKNEKSFRLDPELASQIGLPLEIIRKLTFEQQKELVELVDEINNEAKNVVEDYSKNPSKLSGSTTINIHQNSPFLDTEKDSDEPLYSGSRWTHVLKTKI
tara:strand:+ start:421 stop:738 length:318 start_codon:yes stop_codon:yes gene_type:complete